MRAGVCTVQQALTAEAAAVVKQAVSLARRRGNAQVTPLHVASAMLHASTGLLRAACLRSHSHPLQCKALELCFNVALNRLPAGSPLHGHVYYPPSLSNALVAAFKRAQAHQRRGGSVDTNQQQQPVLAVKIELEQLVISILDDPSVSRVMREAGFSSPQVKANVEHAVVSSIEGTKGLTNPNPSSSSSPPTEFENKPAGIGKLPVVEQVREEDVAAILDCLASGRSKRRVMVVAESSSAAEAAAMAAVDRIKEKAAPPRVISISVSMFRDALREDAERRLGELRRAVARDSKAAAGGSRGVVLVVEDLRWAAEFWAGRVGRRSASSSCYYYCAVEHAVGEVRALACRGEGDGVWLVAYGSYQAYMRCRAGNPSLESLWGIQPLAIPSGSLALSLSSADVDSAIALSHRQSTSPACLSLLDASCSGQPMAAVSSCCGDCSATNPDAMRSASHRSIVPSSSTNIPPWLRHCRDQELPPCKNWSSTTCGGSASQRTTQLNFSTAVSPSSSVSSYEQYYNMHQPYQPWIVADVHEPSKHSWRAKCSFDNVLMDEAVEGVKLLSAAAVKSKSRDSSASNGGSVEVGCRSRSFKEVSAENLKVLCGALEKEVPWQKEIVPEIASTVLRCRSGMAKRRDAMKAKEETWMLFLGGDTDGKLRVARELAGLVFGSRKSFVSIDADACSPARSDSFVEQKHHGSKRHRSEASHLERLFEAVRDNPHRVILMEGVERVDRRCQMGIKEAIESGVVRRSHSGAGAGADDDDVASLGDAIVVLCCDSFDSRSRACSPPTMSKKAKAKSDDDDKSNDRHDNEAASCFDLNMSVDEDQEVVVDEYCSFGDAGLIKAVDRTLFFRTPEEV
ncbi:protein SMAX1-LIKE 3 [Brachypodium distachyon]|uniref:Clp R domain-containing protein n=1 Tax=Brachypodium distachyon TaxID=15368 RepID=A0A0Q3IGH4_BRADI|nr:protein SMAX1-LIKE 3 [Brachypodium distachyon]KQJ99771.1 hypothetical protein BRADI_3g45150v3 [Brachypodium distachyon]|eukprot:XP_014756053.1 protein SMAX1-LIKE 3 [Brachypodium distachyon]